MNESLKKEARKIFRGDGIEFIDNLIDRATLLERKRCLTTMLKISPGVFGIGDAAIEIERKGEEQTFTENWNRVEDKKL